MDIKEQLAEPFPKSVEKVLQKGNAKLTYVPVSEVITRLNDVFGIGGWGYTINRCKRDEIDSDFVVAHVTLRIFNSMQQEVYIDGIGGQKINRTRNGDIIELGDDMKGAVSDALKKAAQALGIGLYLARSEEPVRDTDTREKIVKEVSDSLVTDAQIKTLRNLFAQLYGKDLPAETVASQLLKREVIDIATVTRAEASNLIGQAIQARKDMQ